MEKEKEPTPPAIEYRRDPQDYVVEYSNNAVVEPTNWILRSYLGKPMLLWGLMLSSSTLQLRFRGRM